MNTFLDLIGVVVFLPQLHFHIERSRQVNQKIIYYILGRILQRLLIRYIYYTEDFCLFPLCGIQIHLLDAHVHALLHAKLTEKHLIQNKSIWIPTNLENYRL